MDTLKKLIDIGFAPMIAVAFVVVIVLWGTLCGVIIYGFRLFLKDRAARDALRQEQLTDLDGRLVKSEEKHDECDKDRVKIHKRLESLSEQLDRYKRCHKTDCPHRLP